MLIFLAAVILKSLLLNGLDFGVGTKVSLAEGKLGWVLGKFYFNVLQAIRIFQAA